MQKWKIINGFLALLGITLLTLDYFGIITFTADAVTLLSVLALIASFIAMVVKGKQQDKEEDEAHIEEKIKERDRYFENKYNAGKNE
ncbi:hypothetical protein [Sinobaca sp. H24]|uniref:hypothetical protein n=1 Tax=Sinobaca sp. H24 TaxID=2923376 RepID=UPI0020799B09|nr:hypothetical protein [Sinobaca sp. H24]